MRHYKASILETIGQTPLVQLNRLTEGLKGNIFAKLEYVSPGLSKKDRVALQMIEDAEKKGLLKKGQPVVELTSGNMGTGLAIVCQQKGYPFIAVMSKGNSIERAKMMKAFGAEVILVDQLATSVAGQVSGGDLALVEEKAQALTKELGAFRADQFYNESTMLAGEQGIGPEIIEQLGQIPIDIFVDFMGTGGSFIGVSRAIKKVYPKALCFGIEPENAPYYSSDKKGSGKHKIQGGGYNYDLHFINQYGGLINGFLRVTDEQAIEGARMLAQKECIFAGFSSGANIAVALDLLSNHYMGKNIVILLPDSGTKYLSTDLWDLN